MIVFLIIVLIIVVIGAIWIIKSTNKRSQEEINQLKQTYKQELYNTLYDEIKNQAEKDLEFLKTQKLNLENEINDKNNFNNTLLKLREEEVDKLIEEKKNTKITELNYELEKLKEETQETIQKELDEWMKSAQEASSETLQDVLEEIADNQEQLNIILADLEEFKIKQASINEEIRRQDLLNSQLDNYKIILSIEDKEDINYLLSIIHNIRNKELLYKLIWSEYLQKPFNDMIKKSFGSKIPKNVVYCIQNIETNKRYIGRTKTEISKRWTEHIKTSLNIGTVSKNYIHEALFNHWDEFTFTILEIVKDEKELSSREKYYIDFYETDKYGYNLKSGG